MCVYICDKSKGIKLIGLYLYIYILYTIGSSVFRLFDARILCHCLKTPWTSLVSRNGIKKKKSSRRHTVIIINDLYLPAVHINLHTKLSDVVYVHLCWILFTVFRILYILDHCQLENTAVCCTSQCHRYTIPVCISNKYRYVYCGNVVKYFLSSYLL